MSNSLINSLMYAFMWLYIVSSEIHTTKGYMGLDNTL